MTLRSNPKFGERHHVPPVAQNEVLVALRAKIGAESGPILFSAHRIAFGPPSDFWVSHRGMAPGDFGSRKGKGPACGKDLPEPYPCDYFTSTNFVWFIRGWTSLMAPDGQAMTHEPQ